MINIYSNFLYVNDLISKNNGTHLSPEEYSRYAKNSSEEKFSQLIGEENNNVTVYGRNRVLDNRLRHLRKRVPLIFNNGIAPIPDFCGMVRSVQRTVDEQALKPLDEDRTGMVRKDPLARPNGEDIYYAEDEKTFRLIGTPPTILECVLEYIKTPNIPVLGYTRGANGRSIVYNPTTSVDFEWDSRQETDLTNRILAKVGLSMTSPTVIQVANNNMNRE